MAVTFLIAGAAVALTAAYVMTRPNAEVVLAGENTAVGLSDAAAETMSGGQGQPQQPLTDWQVTTVADLTDAEDLLDCLEAQGVAERELVVLGNSCFAVRWR